MTQQIRLEGEARKNAITYLRRELLLLAEQRRQMKKKGNRINRAMVEIAARNAYKAFFEFRRTGNYADARVCAMLRG
jgi:DNA polymerase III delta subunit